MLPIILVSTDEKISEKYIADYVQEHKIFPYYIYQIIPEKKEISIEQIRLIKKEIIVSTKDKRLFIIKSFDTASLEAQNALLKTFEENTQVNGFILLVQNEQSVIATIRSRSKVVDLEKKLVFGEVESDLKSFIADVEKSKDYSFLGSKLIAGLDSGQAGDLIKKIIVYFGEKLKNGDLKSTQIIKKAIVLSSLLKNNNLNPQITIDALLIYIKKTFTIK